jgi:hypothetical protein
MSFIEWVKDTVGIMDDAQDYLDKVQDRLSKAQTISKRLSQLQHRLDADARKVKNLAKSASKEKNETRRKKKAQQLAKHLDDLDFRQPILFGKTSLEVLVEAHEDLYRLSVKLDRAKFSGVDSVKRRVKTAKTSIAKTIREHLDLLKKLDGAQRSHRDVARELLTAAAVGGSVSVGIGLVVGSVSLVGGLAGAGGSVLKKVFQDVTQAAMDARKIGAKALKVASEAASETK